MPYTTSQSPGDPPQSNGHLAKTTQQMVLLCLLGLVFSACAPRHPLAPSPEMNPELPGITARTGSLEVDLAYPAAGTPNPGTDSTILYGSVGTGEATLHINRFRVPLAPNGTFLTYLPIPDDETFELIARTENNQDAATFRFGEPVTAADARPFSPARRGSVLTGRDTLDTGSEIVAGRNAPGGDRRYFFPQGAHLSVSGKAGNYYRIQLTQNTTTWVHQNTIQLHEPIDHTSPPIGSVTAQSASNWHDVRIEGDYFPFAVTTDPRSVSVTVYGHLLQGDPLSLENDVPGLEAAWTTATADSSVLAIHLPEPLWGYKAFYDSTGALVLRLRKPPAVSQQSPFEGVSIVVDAGHPPSGTYGPTGYLEPEANLRIAQKLRDKLEARGAQVYMTRTSKAALENATWAPQELWARVRYAVENDANLLVSIHNNALPAGVNPFQDFGSLVFYFHGFAQPLAQSLLDEMVQVTHLPNPRASWRSLALTRPTWMPAVLTESLYMIYPQQEAALKQEAFLDQLAEAHLRGIEQFIRGHLPQDRKR